jgi:hypothetical protein
MSELFSKVLLCPDKLGSCGVHLLAQAGDLPKSICQRLAYCQLMHLLQAQPVNAANCCMAAAILIQMFCSCPHALYA